MAKFIIKKRGGINWDRIEQTFSFLCKEFQYEGKWIVGLSWERNNESQDHIPIDEYSPLGSDEEKNKILIITAEPELVYKLSNRK
jgi:hypothetical protein